MPKKSRRSKSKYRARQTKAVQERHLEQPKPATPDTTKLAATKSRMPGGIPHKSPHPIADYRHIGIELKYIGILAGALVAILIILSFILG